MAIEALILGVVAAVAALCLAIPHMQQAVRARRTARTTTSSAEADQAWKTYSVHQRRIMLYVAFGFLALASVQFLGVL